MLVVALSHRQFQNHHQLSKGFDIDHQDNRTFLALLRLGGHWPLIARKALQLLADNTGVDGVPLADLMEVNNESARDASNRISHIRTTHGLDIINISPRSNAGSVYRLVGFTQPGERKAKRKPKPKKEKGELVMPKLHNSLLLQVFC